MVNSMDMCDSCMERQNWLLESGDGSQVICYDRFSNSVEGAGDEDNLPTSTDACTQTPMKRISTTVPDAPKRKIQKPNWMDSGCDIRRNLFANHNWKKMEDVKDMQWAILRVDTIATSPTHRCVRRFYIGDKDGVNYLEMEFYPCVAYANLSEEYKELFHFQSSHSHRLRYNPHQRVPPCSVAVSKINDFIVYNDIELVLFNEVLGSYNEKVDLTICEELGIQYLNIRWTSTQYDPIPKRRLKYEKNREDDLTFAPPFIDIPSDEDYRAVPDRADKNTI